MPEPHDPLAARQQPAVSAVALLLRIAFFLIVVPGIAVLLIKYLM